MATKYQPLVDHIAAQNEQELTLSFTEIEAIVGSPLAESMRINTAVWTSTAYALVWRLEALGWHARLDRRNRCVHFTRDTEEG
jgi:hypothetical protein